MSVDAVLFDLDGTLVDTAPDLVAVLNRLLAEEGQPPAPYAIARNEASNGAAGLIKLGFGLEPTSEQYEGLRERFLDIYSSAVCVKSRPFLSLESILDVASTCAWGVVTNKPHSLTVPLLERLGLLDDCACVISGDRLPQKKPHPAPLLLAAEELGVNAERCVYVGDAPRDIEAGRHARMATIVAAYGYIRADLDVSEWGADLIVRRPRDLAAAIGSLAKRLTDDAA
jgi:phosphoglycolate phosphatase